MSDDTTPTVSDTPQYARPADLMAVRIMQEDVTLPSGVLVRVRGLNRLESAVINKRAKGDQALEEQLVVQLGLVEPEMTITEVKAWYRGAPASDVIAVAKAISDLTDGTRTAKEWTKSLPD